MRKSDFLRFKWNHIPSKPIRNLIFSFHGRKTTACSTLHRHSVTHVGRRLVSVDKILGRVPSYALRMVNVYSSPGLL